MIIDKEKQYKARNGKIAIKVCGILPDKMSLYPYYVYYDDGSNFRVNKGGVCWNNHEYDLVEELKHNLRVTQSPSPPGMFQEWLEKVADETKEKLEHFQGEFIPGEEYEDRERTVYRFVAYDMEKSVFYKNRDYQYVARTKEGEEPMGVTKLDIIRHVPKPKEKVKLAMWANVYDSGRVYLMKNIHNDVTVDNCHVRGKCYTTEGKIETRIACIPVEIEYYEGEGL